MYWVRCFIEATRKQEACARSEKAGLEYWIKMEQLYYFPKLYAEIKRGDFPSGELWRSYEFYMQNGVVLVAGRLRRPGVPLMHKDSHLTLVWLEYIHNTVLSHAGGAGTLKVTSRESLWVWKGTSTYNQVCRSCQHCTRRGNKADPQAMAPLPYYRHTSARPTAFKNIFIGIVAKVVFELNAGRLRDLCKLNRL